MKKYYARCLAWMLLVLLLMDSCMERVAARAARDPYAMRISASKHYTTVRLGYRQKLGDVCDINVWIYNDSASSYTVTMTSSKEDVLQPVAGSVTVPENVKNYQNFTFSYQINKAGAAVLTFVMGDKKLEQTVFVIGEEGTPITAIEQTDYKTMKITWESREEFSGYYIMRTAEGNSEFETIKTVEGGDVSSASITNMEWDKKYTYMVRGYMRQGTDVVTGSAVNANGRVAFAMKKMGASITGIEKTGSSSVKIKWDKMSGATKYQLYVSDAEDGDYKCIYTADKENAVSYTQKVAKGKAYYYKIRTSYPEMISDYSKVVSKMLPMEASVLKKKIKLSKNPSIDSQYGGWNWSSSDDAFYYMASGKLHVAEPGKNCLHIYTLDKKLKRVKSKTIKISYQYFGGFYHGTDGNFYVAVGYNNPKEEDEKTVIKVLQYDKNWKKGKSCDLKGSSSNAFKGIYTPFDAGNCRMDMQGTTLYLHTCRAMYAGSDGVRHQSNISFAIDTKSMTGDTTEDAYVSHSFNQYVRFDNENLYLLDHGDAYPRGVILTAIRDYASENKKSKESNLFTLMGETGDNRTECTVGGMEISRDKVLVCGTSQPHKDTVKGVTGWSGQGGKALKHNAYLLVTDQETLETKVKWLTQYHPKKSKVHVGETRMVKLDDDHFAILYNTTGKSKKPTLHYVVCDGEGQKLYTKTYANMTLSGGTQPVVYQGRTVWVDNDHKQGKTMVYAIPALPQ